MARKRLRKTLKSATARIRFKAEDLRLVDTWATESEQTRSDVIRALVDQEKQRRAQVAAWNDAIALSPSAAMVLSADRRAA